ncbi:SIS domain-containing protein [Pseudogemmatithrix spongiicola]|uniref:Phosphoheptose isomerase n=1 Tax=Pseudogemmatithrix spongiicola TaxID=3062599 RepID=A0AA49K0D2_9BACT|nr:SIS domain-containing protein [Gemmatimonadaceae bacterium 'strain 138']WKW15369.1 SIS domain-containing protein [Gemmatimonadaceae bacterium 'strain 318']
MSQHPVMSAVQHLRDLSETAARAADALAGQIAEATEMTRECLRGGGTLFFAGNGGSAADAQHIATEYTIRYLRTRRALRAVALTTDTSALTAAGNDFSFDEIFSRQVEALGRAGDLLFVHTTSGNSPNCLRAIEAAKALGMKTVALTAKDGGKVKGMADLTIIVPTTRTDRAQELHLAIQHAICDAVDADVAHA